MASKAYSQRRSEADGGEESRIVVEKREERVSRRQPTEAQTYSCPIQSLENSRNTSFVQEVASITDSSLLYVRDEQPESLAS